MTLFNRRVFIQAVGAMVYAAAVAPSAEIAAPAPLAPPVLIPPVPPDSPDSQYQYIRADRDLRVGDYLRDEGDRIVGIACGDMRKDHYGFMLLVG